MKAYKSMFIAIMIMTIIVMSFCKAENIDLTQFSDDELVQLQSMIMQEMQLRQENDAEHIINDSILEFPLEVGCRNEAVTFVQQKLIDLGLLQGTADGIFGEKTQNALLSLQSIIQWEPTGCINSAEEYVAILSLVPGDGINRLADLYQNYYIEKDKDSSDYESISCYIDPSKTTLDSLKGQTIVASIYVNSPGERGTSVIDSDDEWIANRFGCHLEFRWRDSSGVNDDTYIKVANGLLEQSVDHQRIFESYKVVAPEGYDVLVSACVVLQSGARPAEGNNEIWSLGKPVIEFGSIPSNWN